MNTWAPLWSGIVDSSLWEESGDVVKVFMTILATKDSDHVCRMDAYKISRKCNLDELLVNNILTNVLAAPDTRRKIPQEFEGRRIRMVEDGWQVLNGDKYREMVSAERKKAKNRRAQEAWRHRQKEKFTPTPSGPSPGENAFVASLDAGHEAGADSVLDQL